MDPERGVSYLGPEGIPAELYMRSDLNMVSDNYIASGLEIEANINTITKTPSKDAGYATYNYGDSPTAKLSEKHSYGVQFDLSGITDLTKAILRIYLLDVPNSDNAVQVARFTGSWTEMGLTNRTAPPTTMERSKATPKPGFYDFNVTDIVQAQLALGNYGFRIKSDNSWLYMKVATREYIAAYRPRLIMEYGASSDLTIRSGWAQAGGVLHYFPDTITTRPSKIGTSSLYLNFNAAGIYWITEVSQGISSVCLGKIEVQSNWLISSIDMSPATGRKSGFYEKNKVFGNWYFESPSPYITISKGTYKDIYHNLGESLGLLIMPFFRRVGDTTWCQMASGGSDIVRYGCTYECLSSNRIRVSAGAEKAFFTFTNTGGILTSDTAELKFIVIRLK